MTLPLTFEPGRVRPSPLWNRIRLFGRISACRARWRYTIEVGDLSGVEVGTTVKLWGVGALSPLRWSRVARRSGPVSDRLTAAASPAWEDSDRFIGTVREVTRPGADGARGLSIRSYVYRLGVGPATADRATRDQIAAKLSANGSGYAALSEHLGVIPEGETGTLALAYIRRRYRAGEYPAATYTVTTSGQTTHCDVPHLRDLPRLTTVLGPHADGGPRQPAAPGRFTLTFTRTH